MAQGDRYHSGKWGWFSKKDKPKKKKRSKAKKSKWWNRISMPKFDFEGVINFPNINMDWLLNQSYNLPRQDKSGTQGGLWAQDGGEINAKIINTEEELAEIEENYQKWLAENKETLMQDSDTIKNTDPMDLDKLKERWSFKKKKK